MKKKFFILDGSSLLYRAFYALPLLESKSGEYTNAIYGFSTMLIKLLTEWKPDYLVIAFDKGKKTFRNDMFPEYKGTRKPTPTELIGQIPMLHEMVEAWGITLVEMAGYEADDIIGTLANKAVSEGCEAYIVTGDRDALQLVKPDLQVLFTKKGISELKKYDEEAFQEEYQGLDPIQLIDLKGLMGDTSDNIPGVPGIGPKTAIKLIAAYSSVEQVLLHIEEIAGKKLKENLQENQQQAVLSKELATICTTVPVECNLADTTININPDALVRFYTRYNISSMLRAIKPFVESANQEVTTPVAEAKLQLPKIISIENTQVANKVYQLAQKAGKIVLGANFFGKIPNKKLQEFLILVGDKAYSMPFAPETTGGMESLFGQESDTRKPEVWQVITELLADNKIDKYLHNLKEYYHGQINIQGKIYDLELIGYLLNPVSSKYDISELAHEYAPLLGEATQQESSEEKILWQLAVMEYIQATMWQLLEERNMQELYWQIELPLVEVLAAMEKTGIYVNRQHLQTQSVEVANKLAVLQEEIYQLAQGEFNINSPKQLGEVLFEKLGLPAAKKTKTGYSTNAEVLNQLVDQHAIIPKILEYRLWTKLKSTYLDGIGQLIDDTSQRVHTTFNQTVTATGRLSSSDPNLQNIPVRREEGKHIRELFEPGPGYDMILSADYSQIELRVLADMSQDASFIKAFNNQEDIHARTAAEVFGVPMEEVTADLRRKAKAVNFGIVYGISDYGLSQDLHISRGEAKSYIESYFAKCAGVKAFIDKVVSQAHELGYTCTMFNRRRDLPAIRSSNYMQRSLAERMAMNTPIQGTAADIIKLAMIRAFAMLQEQGLKSRILVQVHDELVLEVISSEEAQVRKVLQEAMEGAVKLSIPLTIDINTGSNWAEAK